MRKYIFGGTAAVLVALIGAFPASADTCVGTCGSLGADGVVTPTGNGQYQYISTTNGKDGAGQVPPYPGTNGSQFTTSAFSAKSGDVVQIYFNYITSDGSLPQYGNTQYGVLRMGSASEHRRYSHCYSIHRTHDALRRHKSGLLASAYRPKHKADQHIQSW